MATEIRYEAENREITIKELITDLLIWVRYIWSNRYILLVAGLLGCFIGLFYSLTKKPKYVATTTFVLEGANARSSLSRLAGMAAISGFDFGGDPGGLFQGDNILELYKSRTMIVETLLSKTHPNSNELLVDRFIAFNKLNADWEDQEDLRDLDFRAQAAELSGRKLRLRDSILSRIVEMIREDVLAVDKPDKKLSLYQVQVTSPDEEFSKAFNDNLVDRVNDFYIKTKTQKTLSNIALLEIKVDSVRNEMEKAIYSAVQITDATPNLNPTRQVQRAAPSQKAQYTAEANKLMLAQLIQNLELARMNLSQEQPLIQMVDRPVYPLPVLKLGKLKAMILGGFIIGFLILWCLIGYRWYNTIMSGE